MKLRWPKFFIIACVTSLCGCAGLAARNELVVSSTPIDRTSVSSRKGPSPALSDSNLKRTGFEHQIRRSTPLAVVTDPLSIPTPSELTGPQPVEIFLRRALIENRTVRAARSNVEAMRARIPQVTSLEDPVVSNTIFPFPSNGPQYSLMGYMPYEMMIAQQFPWLGTLRLRGAAAAADVDVAIAELAAAELDVVATIKRGYYDLFFNGRAETILSENRALVLDFIDLARKRYETGSTSQQDVLRAEVLLADLDRELVTTRQSLATARADLAQQLHISPEAELQALEALPPSAVPTAIDELYRLAAFAKPELQGRLAAVARDERAVDLARKRYYPNITLGVNYGLMTKRNAASPAADGRDNAGLFVGFNMPIYHKKLDAGVQEAQARTRADSQLFESERDKTYREIKDLMIQAKAQREILELLRARILPRSRQALEIAANDYRTGNVDYLTLISAWREVLQVELQIAQVESELGKALASLERAVGIELTAQAETPLPPPEAEIRPSGRDASRANILSNRPGPFAPRLLLTEPATSPGTVPERDLPRASP